MYQGRREIKEEPAARAGPGHGERLPINTSPIGSRNPQREARCTLANGRCQSIEMPCVDAWGELVAQPSPVDREIGDESLKISQTMLIACFWSRH